MMTLLRNLFGGRSQARGRFGGSDRRGQMMQRFGGRRGGMLGLGSIAAIVAPFIIRKMRSRRAVSGAGY